MTQDGFGVSELLVSTTTSIIEHGPVARYAEAVGSHDRVFSDTELAVSRGLTTIPAPPTFTFSALAYWGALSLASHEPPKPASDEPLLKELHRLSLHGGVTLHAEEEFVFHRPLLVGDRITSSGALVDVYEKRGHNGPLSFVVVERQHHRADTTQLVATTRTTLVNRRTT